MIRIMYFIVFCTAGIALSGCSSSSPGFAERARGVVTGANPPALTSAQIAERAQDVTQNANVLEVSRAHYITDNELYPEFVVESDCSGTNCPFVDTEPSVALALELGLEIDEVEELLALEGVEPVLTKNGVTTFLREMDGVNAYGAWLEHGVFAVAEDIDDTYEQGIPGIKFSGVLSLAGGQVSGSRPSVNATYRGLMVGSPVDGAHRGNTLQGDAELVFTAADNEIDAHFTDIVDLDRGSPHATSRIDFENLAVDEDGIFADDQPGNGILGGFAGPDHAEALGIFESDNIVGAFGAIRE